MLLVLLSACNTPEPPARPPDVLMVVIDTLRADALSAYGNPRPTTPQIDALAEAGVLFTDVTSPGSWTWPGHASLFTGQPQWINGARTRSVVPEDMQGEDNELAAITPMRTDLPTLAEIFSAAGYRTTSFAQNGWLDPDLGLMRGFDRAEVIKSSCETLWDTLEQDLEIHGDKPQLAFINLMRPHAPWGISPSSWSQAHAGLTTSPPEWAAPFVTSTQLDLYRLIAPDQPSGFQAYMTGHRDIPPEGLAMIRDLYEGEVAVADYCLNKGLTRWLARSPDSIIVVTSDHGEYLGERGMLEHGQTIWQGLTAIPLIIAAPGRLPAGQRVTTPVQLHDVSGTVLELAGLESPMQSLVPVIKGAPRDGPILAAAWHHPGPAEKLGGPFLHDWFLYREGTEALVWSPTGEDQLFDLTTDPAALHDVAQERPDRVAALRAAAENAYPLHNSTGTLSASPEREADLRALGYIE